MPRKCKHALASTMPWPTGGATSFQDSLDVAGRPIRWCTHCGVRLPLGPSNETDERVAVELRAATIAATLRDTHVPSLTECEQHGWETHANIDEGVRDLPILCERDDFHAGYLARCIVEHKEGES